MLLPGERVVWRHDPEEAAGPKWPYLLGAAMPLLILAVLAVIIATSASDFPRFMVFIVLLFLLPALFCTLPLLDGIWSRAVAVTPDRVVWRSGIGRLGRESSAQRRDIAAATVYEGSNVLILHHRDGRTLRLAGMEQAESLGHALHVRTRIWRKGADASGQLPFWHRLAGPVLSLFPGDWLVKGLIHRDWVVFDRFGILVLLVVILLLAGLAAAQIWLHVAAARKLSPEDRRKQACRIRNRLCRGKEPPRKVYLSLIAMPFAMFELWLVRVAYGGPYDCDCQSEVFEPSSSKASGGGTT